MRKYQVIAIISCFAVLMFGLDAHALFKSAKVTLLVVNEDGVPLKGVDAGVSFEKNTGSGTDSNAQRGITDALGQFTATGSCNGHIGYGARKEGFYRSHYDYDFDDLGVFGWEPWNPELKVLMRRVENPVPMYARHAKIKLPVIGKEVGFDLIKYDWVTPYGSGLNADFIFYLERRFSNRNDYEGKLDIKFQNSNDGIVKISESFSNGSQFKLPRYAMGNGFLPAHSMETSQNPSGKWVEGYQQNDCYIFRVRSEVKDGKLIKAMYGKIRGPIKFEPRIDPTEVYFTYYLNPDYTRNLEFDPKRNLFNNLNDFQKVSEP